MAAQTKPMLSARGLIEDGGLRAVFQPIVDLRDGNPIGYEVLARGPLGSELENIGAESDRGHGGRAIPAWVPRRSPDENQGKTPFDRIAEPDGNLSGDKRLLLALSRQLEEEAFALQGESVVLATFQDVRFFTPSVRRRYEQLAEEVALVGALGLGMPSRPGAGVRGASLGPDDRLVGEWDVVVVGPHFSGAFVARDLGDCGPDFERRFEYFLTYDRAQVIEAARPLLHHLVRSK